MTPSAADVALLLERMRAELAGLSRDVIDLQGGLGAAIAATANQDPDIIPRAQMLDLVAQTLAELAAFLSALRRQGGGGEAFDLGRAAAGLGLARLGDRPAGRASSTSIPDLDLF